MIPPALARLVARSRDHGPSALLFIKPIEVRALADAWAALESEREALMEQGESRARERDALVARVQALEGAVHDPEAETRMALVLQAADDPDYRWRELARYVPMARAAVKAALASPEAGQP